MSSGSLLTFRHFTTPVPEGVAAFIVQLHSISTVAAVVVVACQQLRSRSMLGLNAHVGAAPTRRSSRPGAAQAAKGRPFRVRATAGAFHASSETAALHFSTKQDVTRFGRALTSHLVRPLTADAPESPADVAVWGQCREKARPWNTWPDYANNISRALRPISTSPRHAQMT